MTATNSSNFFLYRQYYDRVFKKSVAMHDRKRKRGRTYDIYEDVKEVCEGTLESYAWLEFRHPV